MAIVYLPALIVGGVGGPDKLSVPVWADGNQGANQGAYIANNTAVSVPDVNQLTSTERKSWVSYKENKIWYIRIKGGERWVEYSHVKMVAITPAGVTDAQALAALKLLIAWALKRGDA